MQVTVHLNEQSQPVVHTDVRNAYQKGSFYCVMDQGGNVTKYPVQHIFRVVEQGS